MNCGIISNLLLYFQWNVFIEAFSNLLLYFLLYKLDLCFTCLIQIDFLNFTLVILLLGKNDRKSFLESMMSRSSHPEVSLVKSVLKICSKSAGKHPRQNVISIKLLCNFIEIALLFECSSVRTPLSECFWMSKDHKLKMRTLKH